MSNDDRTDENENDSDIPMDPKPEEATPTPPEGFGASGSSPPEGKGQAATSPLKERTRQSKKDRQANEWGKDVLDLVNELDALEATAEKGTWKAVLISHQLRAKFPDRSKSAEEGWIGFCKTVLNRSRKTIWSRLVVAKYCEKHVADWKSKAVSGDLPSVWLVRELALCKECPELRVQHAILFDGQYESSEDFAEGLRDLRAVKAEQAARGETSTGNDAPKPKGEGKSGNMMPVDKAVEVVQQVLAEVKTTKTLHVAAWTDATDIIRDLDSKITANERLIITHGAVIVISPRPKDGISPETGEAPEQNKEGDEHGNA